MSTICLSPSADPDAALVLRLRAGDRGAFATLVERYEPTMLRVARHHVRTTAVAEEVVQEAWVGLLEGLDRFEGRSTLKTWLFRILTNRAKTRGERERRCVPFSALSAEDDTGPAVEPDRFLPPGDGHAPGAWAAAPSDWRTVPEDRLLARETLDRLGDAISGLPARQRAVVVLRDVEGHSPADVCTALGVSEANQRVLLHRGRAKVRAALATYLDEAAAA